MKVLPQIVPFLLLIWGDSYTKIFIAGDNHVWNSLTLYDGLFQGHNLSSLLFCLGMRRAMRKFEESCRTRFPGGDFRRILHLDYIDDMFLKLPQENLSFVLSMIEGNCIIRSDES